MRLASVFILILLPALLSAQQPCDCCDWQKKGDRAYLAGRFEQALGFYENALQSKDASVCYYLDFLLARTRLQIAILKRSDGPEAEAAYLRCKAKYDEELKKFQAMQEAEKNREKQATQADDELWKQASTGGKTAIEAYLAKYPGGRHVEEAREALTRLEIEARGNPRPDTAKMAFVKGGTFMMGAFDGKGHDDEMPAHRVTVSSFYLSKTELTFAEFDAYCAATGAQKPRDQGLGRGNLPVFRLTWWEALLYCNWRSEQEGLIPVYTIDKSAGNPEHPDIWNYSRWTVTANWAANGYRLPTEAEWEYAARAVGGQGGGTARFGNGKDVADFAGINCNLSGDFSEKAIPGQFRNKILDVTALPPNSLGLYHMSGNVAEWCWDLYEYDYYEKSADAKNPRGSLVGKHRVYRGGDYFYETDGGRTTNREYAKGDHSVSSLGFRVARNAE